MPPASCVLVCAVGVNSYSFCAAIHMYDEAIFLHSQDLLLIENCNKQTVVHTKAFLVQIFFILF